MKVKVYMISNVIHELPARDIPNAREIAKRIIMEGLWIVDEEEEFYNLSSPDT
ncbi:unnamed protein product [marine sediment metagenome]|uniref:Uncharacterized protein n=1 Tax=marine sediment metagenome TaxID=412755 RepID=X1TCA9_9ZZZZ